MVYVRAKLTFGFFGDTHDLLFGKRISCVIDLFPSFSLLGTKRKPVIELVVVKIRTYICILEFIGIMKLLLFLFIYYYFIYLFLKEEEEFLVM
jgi:hypothetical protein